MLLAATNVATATIVACAGILAVVPRRASAWAWECAGSAMVVVFTSLPGPLLGPLGWYYEWVGFHIGILAADRLSGAHVNPAATTAFLAYGNLGLAEWAARVSGQMAGGCLGFVMLKHILATCCDLQIGGPATASESATYDAAVSEGVATFLLLSAVIIASETVGSFYWIKMSCIAGAVRAIIQMPPLIAPTGPAVNPMIATSYHIVLHDALPADWVRFLSIYWVAACSGSIAAAFLWFGVAKALKGGKKQVAAPASKTKKKAKKA